MPQAKRNTACTAELMDPVLLTLQANVTVCYEHAVIEIYSEKRHETRCGGVGLIFLGKHILFQAELQLATTTTLLVQPATISTTTATTTYFYYYYSASPSVSTTSATSTLFPRY